MKKTFIPFIVDCLLSSMASFLFFFVLLNYFVSRPYSYIWAFILTAVFTVAIAKYLLKKKYKTDMKNADLKKYKQIITQLNFSSDRDCLTLIEKSLIKKGLNVKHKKGGLFIPEENKMIFCHFGFDEINKADVVKYFNSLNKDEIAEIYTENPKNVREFAERFSGKIKILDGENCYLLLKETDNFPPVKFIPFENKKANLKNIFYKKRAKTFLGFGIFFLLSSYFVPLKIYYVVCGMIMLVISVVCLIFGKTEKT